MINKKEFFIYLQAMIKNGGLRMTAARKSLLGILVSEGRPLTAEDAYIILHENKKDAGIATIYRNLHVMENFGLVLKTFRDGIAEYNANTAIESTSEFKSFTAKSGYVQQKQLKAEKIKKPGFQSGQLELLSDDTGVFGKLRESNILKYLEINKINKIQSQLSALVSELDKSKREKESELEELILDIDKIDKILARHQYDKSSLIQVLIDLQAEYNWLPKHALFHIGTKLDMPLTRIYSIATFYKFFNLEPRGKYQILVCAGTACHVRDSVRLLQRVSDLLKVKPGDTTQDFKFTLDTVNCLGCCALGPVIYFNKKYYSNPSTKQLEKLFGSIS